ncbi:MAG: hypothetical protein MUO34_13585 [Ignavibacteriaceae bacterium]|nr:hypothetical protein [Ignavibacteriaceae bacterium]
MKTIFAVVSTFILLFISCNEQSTEPITQTVELLPLKLGNYWIYRVGIKDSYNDTILSFRDTLRVIEQTERGFLLQSRLQIILLNGYYKNDTEGLYMNDTLQFKYPGVVDEECGLMGLGNIIDIYGNKPEGIISRTDFKYSFVTSADTITFSDCYYYFLLAFYFTDEIKKSGYTIFKPGIGLVASDWADINEVVNEFYNPFVSLVGYHLE